MKLGVDLVKLWKNKLERFFTVNNLTHNLIFSSTWVKLIM